MTDKPHRLITPLKGPLISDLTEPGAYLSGKVDAVAEKLRGPKSLLEDTSEAFGDQVDAVASVLERGGPAAAFRQRDDLDREQARLVKECDLLDSLSSALDGQPQTVVADQSGFHSRRLAKSIRVGKVRWAKGDEPKGLANKITLAQKFKIADEIPDLEDLYDFGVKLREEGLLRMPFDQMYVEYKLRVGSEVLQFAMYAEDFRVYSFILHRNRWFCMKSETGDPEFTAFLVLLASRSTTVLPSDERGAPMEVAEGAKPKFSHHIVRINAFDGERSSHGGHHAPPRLHWRRGHIRRQRCGPGRRQIRKTWIAPMLVGSADRGVVTHDYEVRK